AAGPAASDVASPGFGSSHHDRDCDRDPVAAVSRVPVAAAVAVGSATVPDRASARRFLVDSPADAAAVPNAAVHHAAVNQFDVVVPVAVVAVPNAAVDLAIDVAAVVVAPNAVADPGYAFADRHDAVPSAVVAVPDFHYDDQFVALAESAVLAGE